MQDVALIIITTSHVEAIDVFLLDIDRSANLSLLPPRFDNLHREDSEQFCAKIEDDRETERNVTLSDQEQKPAENFQKTANESKSDYSEVSKGVDLYVSFTHAATTKQGLLALIVCAGDSANAQEHEIVFWRISKTWNTREPCPSIVRYFSAFCFLFRRPHPV